MKSHGVNKNLNTFLVKMFVFITDRVIGADDPNLASCRGRKPLFSDAELLCLAVAQHLTCGDY